MTKALQRGEVWLVDLGLAAKTRPALVLSIAVEDQDRS
jgi:mRNA interferase MazF